MSGSAASRPPPAGERDLGRLLRTMDPELQPGSYVFTTVPEVPAAAEPVVLVREPEGITLVLPREQADRLGLTYAYVAAMVTLRVHSALDAVGLTAAVAGALAGAGLSCNVVAGYHHDHLFVPVADGELAVELLRRLAELDG
jgi:uncharacterized protein